MRGWVVLLVVLVSSAPAAAKRIACERQQAFTLPHDSTKPLPDNAKIWSVDDKGQVTITPRHVEAMSTQDQTAPAAPQLYSLSVEVGYAVSDRQRNVTSVYLSASFPSDDTALVRLTFTDAADQNVELWTTPGRPYLCNPGISLAPGPALVSIAAIDIAGNESSIVTKVVVEHRRKRGHGFEVLFFMMLVPIGAVVWVVALFIRSSRRRARLSLPGEDVSPLVAETMARSLVAETLQTITMSLLLIGALYFSDDEIAAAIVAYVPFTRMFRLAIVSRFLRMLETGKPATLHDGNALAANGYYIWVPDRIRKDAYRAGVPAAIKRS